jgi:hypothetical protein
MRSRAEYEEAMRWVTWGLNDCQISRMTGIPSHTICDWRNGKRKDPVLTSTCPICDGRPLDGGQYSYLLGLYLGDGCISEHPRTTRLRITLDIRYVNIIDECAAAIDIVRAGMHPAGFVNRLGCVEVNSYWSHWPCVFPQHGPGRKHLRTIRLTPWQQEVTGEYPDRLLRGLIHSDGSRDLNWVNGKSYPRYQFSNNSADIQEIFCSAAELIGVRWNRPFWKTISVARRPDVETLDAIIGPKT